MENGYLSSKKEYPQCNTITNYCAPIAELEDVKLIAYEPKDNQKIDIYFNKLLDKVASDGIVVWRISLMFSVAVVVCYYFYNHIADIKLPRSNYYFMIIMNWFAIYGVKPMSKPLRNLMMF